MPVAAPEGAGVEIGSALCHGIGIGHDWPDNETELARGALRDVPVHGEAAVRVLGADDALACVHTGRALVVVAPPGDPFWAGPLPERIWPAIRIVRADAQTGWHGAGARIVSAAESFLRAEGG